MAKVKVVLNRRGVRSELLRAAWTADKAKQIVDKIAAAAGPGMVAEVEVGATRVRGAVITDTVEAMIAEATDRTLTSAIDAGRS